MKKLIIIGWGLLLIICGAIQANTQINRDPFKQSELLSCDEQADFLLKQIQVWQFKGMIKQSVNSYQQIWLTSQNQWLAITTNTVPNVLFPWQIQSIVSDKVIWQAEMPEHCRDLVLWTMQLNES